MIDEKDIAIINLLKENSRITNSKIAKKLNISETAVRKRIKKLEKLGLIKKYTIEIDYKKLGYKISLTGINIKRDSLIFVINELKKIEDIKELWVCSGDHHIIVKIVSKNLEEIHNIIKNMKGVKKIYPSFVLDEVKF